MIAIFEMVSSHPLENGDKLGISDRQMLPFPLSGMFVFS
jgi:hypothetical protein